MMKELLEKLLAPNDVPRPESAHGFIVVGVRALPGELEAREREALANPCPDELPLPFWESYEEGILEPPSAADLKVLERLGITAEEYEILVLEDRLERMEGKSK
jgi:hypothetical protein